MAFRLLLYMVRIWEQHIRERPDATHLPAIIPLVLHHSDRGWKSPTAFEDLLRVDAETFSLIAAHVPRFRFLLDDLSIASDDSPRARAMSALGRLALYCLRHARKPSDIVRHLGRWLALVREVHAAPGGRVTMGLIWRYILVTIEPKTSEVLLENLLKVVGDESKEEIVTLADMLREEGAERGLKAGLSRTLVKQLRTRFGAVPEATVARIAAANAEQLDAWLDRVLTAPTLDEVLSAG